MSTAPLHDLEPSLPDSTDSFMECRNLESLELLRWSVETYPNRVALATGFGAEGIVLIDLLSRVTDKPRVFTLDTGRLHPETYQLMAEVEDRFNLKIEVHFPDHRKVEEMVRTQGINLFYDSVENRKRCCQVRKVEPLQRALKDLDAWITGLRRQQSDYRSNVSKIEVEAEGRLKINPLANWSEEEVWGTHSQEPASLQQAARSKLSQHRLCPLHPSGRTGRGQSGRSLVVGRFPQRVWTARAERRIVRTCRRLAGRVGCDR